MYLDFLQENSKQVLNDAAFVFKFIPYVFFGRKYKKLVHFLLTVSVVYFRESGRAGTHHVGGGRQTQVAAIGLETSVNSCIVYLVFFIKKFSYIFYIFSCHIITGGIHLNVTKEILSENIRHVFPLKP